MGFYREDHVEAVKVISHSGPSCVIFLVSLSGDRSTNNPTAGDLDQLRREVGVGRKSVTVFFSRNGPNGLDLDESDVLNPFVVVEPGKDEVKTTLMVTLDISYIMLNHLSHFITILKM